MADTVVDVPPGEASSEYKVTKLAAILSIAATVVGLLSTVLGDLQASMPNLKWVGLAVTVVGLLSNVLIALGYQNARKAVKAAALASGNSLAKSPDEAAKELAK